MPSVGILCMYKLTHSTLHRNEQMNEHIELGVIVKTVTLILLHTTILAVSVNLSIMFSLLVGLLMCLIQFSHSSIPDTVHGHPSPANVTLAFHNCAKTSYNRKLSIQSSVL